jgi:hypothetical protein
MSNNWYREVEKSELYEGVTKVRTLSRKDRLSEAHREHEIRWKAKVIANKKHYVAYLLTEREAALWVDKKRVELGMPPKNILKKNG